jgi:hypothetical protein
MHRQLPYGCGSRAGPVNAEQSSAEKEVSGAVPEDDLTVAPHARGEAVSACSYDVSRTWRTSRSRDLSTRRCLLAGGAVDTGRPRTGPRPPAMGIDHPWPHLSPAVRLNEHRVLLPLAALFGPRFES